MASCSGSLIAAGRAGDGAATTGTATQRTSGSSRQVYSAASPAAERPGWSGLIAYGMRHPQLPARALSPEACRLGLCMYLHYICSTGHRATRTFYLCSVQTDRKSALPRAGGRHLRGVSPRVLPLALQQQAAGVVGVPGEGVDSVAGAAWLLVACTWQQAPCPP